MTGIYFWPSFFTLENPLRRTNQWLAYRPPTGLNRGHRLRSRCCRSSLASLPTTFTKRPKHSSDSFPSEIANTKKGVPYGTPFFISMFWISYSAAAASSAYSTNNPLKETCPFPCLSLSTCSMDVANPADDGTEQTELHDGTTVDAKSNLKFRIKNQWKFAPNHENHYWFRPFFQYFHKKQFRSKIRSTNRRVAASTIPASSRATRL